MPTLSEFTEDFHGQIHSESTAHEMQTEESFVTLMGDILAESGDSDTVIPSLYMSADGKSRIDGFSYDEDDETICLITTHWLDKTDLENCKVKDSDISKAIDQSTKFLQKSINGELKGKIEESNPANEISNLILEKKKKLKKVKLILITDGIARKKPYDSEEIDGIEVSKTVWDLERTHYYYENGKEEINVDFSEYFDGPLNCIKETSEEGKYTTYLGFIPGKILADMYARWDMKMLDMNVRVFLGRRVKVNDGISKTLSEAPGDFCAYNNGITVFANKITTDESGKGILKAEGFQVVNGGQTTASLYYARKDDGNLLKDISVQMKLTVIHDLKRIDELVAKMSEYSNTQNKVSPVDQHAKLKPHPDLMRISHKTPAPADGSLITFWFYERMRCSYAELKSLTTKTQSQKKAFDLKFPTAQKFDRIKFSKVWEAHLKRPDVVCLGGQKCFTIFNMWLTEHSAPKDFDLEKFFRKTVGLLIIWNKVDSKQLVKKKIEGEQMFPAHRNRIVAYSISWLIHCTEQNIDLEKIWYNQKIPKIIFDTLEKMLPIVDRHIRDTDLDVGEYCKKRICWNKLTEKEFELDERIENEYINKKNKQEYAPQVVSEEVAIEFCKEKGSDAWWKLAKWLAKGDRLTSTARSMCATMGRILGQNREPSAKLSVPSMKHWEDAIRIHEWDPDDH